jgi:hypothetical protein
LCTFKHLARLSLRLIGIFAEKHQKPFSFLFSKSPTPDTVGFDGVIYKLKAENLTPGHPLNHLTKANEAIKKYVVSVYDLG